MSGRLEAAQARNGFSREHELGERSPPIRRGRTSFDETEPMPRFGPLLLAGRLAPDPSVAAGGMERPGEAAAQFSLGPRLSMPGEPSQGVRPGSMGEPIARIGRSSAIEVPACRGGHVPGCQVQSPCQMPDASDPHRGSNEPADLGARLLDQPWRDLVRPETCRSARRRVARSLPDRPLRVETGDEGGPCGPSKHSRASRRRKPWRSRSRRTTGTLIGVLASARPRATCSRVRWVRRLSCRMASPAVCGRRWPACRRGQASGPRWRLRGVGPSPRATGGTSAWSVRCRG